MGLKKIKVITNWEKAAQHNQPLNKCKGRIAWIWDKETMEPKISESKAKIDKYENLILRKRKESKTGLHGIIVILAAKAETPNWEADCVVPSSFKLRRILSQEKDLHLIIMANLH